MSLQTVIVGARTLVYEDGRLNGPLSLFISETYENPHSAASACRTLRIFHRWLEAFEIDLPARALEGEGLKAVERKWLVEIVYRPLEEIERMSPATIRRFGSASKSLRAADIKGGVDPSTARSRLNTIVSFLSWYRTDLLNEAIRSPNLRISLEKRYLEMAAELSSWIAGGGASHNAEIRSLPHDRFLAVIRQLVLGAEQILCAPDGRPSANLLRDRAMALLAAEGLRPGALGNITIDDFKFRPGGREGYLEIKNNLDRRGVPATASTPTQKGISSTQKRYRSTLTLKLWSFTCRAIQEYIDTERDEVLMRNVRNRSKSFLFLASHGGPFTDRTSISKIFFNIGKGLKRLGLLDTAKGDPFAKGRFYEFTAYTLRHSAATLFYTANKNRPDVREQMRVRFGWSSTSSEPDRYASRAMSETSSIDLLEFNESLLRDLEAYKRKIGGR